MVVVRVGDVELVARQVCVEVEVGGVVVVVVVAPAALVIVCCIFQGRSFAALVAETICPGLALVSAILVAVGREGSIEKKKRVVGKIP